MPYVSLSDLIANCPNELVANSIIVFDGCHRVLQEIPAGITCEEITSCIDCEFLLGIITFSTGLLVDPVTCTITGNPDRVNQVITASIDCNGPTPILSIGTQDVDLSCLLWLRTIGFHDASNNFWITNMQSVYVVGEDGLRFEALGWTLTIGLPTTHTNGQVLTWDATNNTSYRANITTLCCDRVYDCMDPIITMLQNQINILAQQLCPCGWDWTGAYIDIYEEGALVHANVAQLNFVGTCLTATWNAGTSQADVTLDLGIDWTWCEVNPEWEIEALLTICGEVIDLSCLAQTPTIQVFDEGLLVHDTLQFNFIGDCLTASWNSLTNTIDVELDLWITRTGCGTKFTVYSYTGTPLGCTTPITITATGPGIPVAVSVVSIWSLGSSVIINDYLDILNAGQNPGVVYTLVSWIGTQTLSTDIDLLPLTLVNPYILTICGTEVDLSCLAELPGLVISDEWTSIEDFVTGIDFVWPCITASSVVAWLVKVEFTPTFTRWGCTGPNAYELDMCGEVVDLSCLALNTDIPLENMAFVAKNGSDTTGLIERLDMPFLTIQAAVDACHTASKPMTVYVYAGEYNERIQPRHKVDIHLCSNATMWGLDVTRWVGMKITGDGNIRIPETTSHGVVYWMSNTGSANISVEVENIYVESAMTWLIDIATERPDEYQKCKVASKYVYMKSPVWDSMMPTWWLLYATRCHQVDMSRWVIEINQPKVTQFMMYNITWGVGPTYVDPIDVYHHHTKIQQSTRVKSLTNDGVAKHWTANNLVLANTNLYQDNIYIEGPFKSSNGDYADSFIYAVGENIIITNNDLLWKLSNGDTTLSGHKIFNVQHITGNNTHCYNRGQNVIQGTGIYDTCFYSAWVAGVYHVGGRTFSNLPSTVAALSSNVFAGVNHLIQDAYAGTELFHPYGAH